MGVHDQFAKKFKTPEEMDAYKEQAQADIYDRLAEGATRLESVNADTEQDTAVAPTPSQEVQTYAALYHGPATSKLSTINTKKQPPSVDAFTGNAIIEQGTLKVFIEKYHDHVDGLRASTLKLLDICSLALTAQNDYRGDENKIQPTVVIPLERYMEMRGIPVTKPSRDKARRTAKSDLETLYSISMEWSEPSGGKTRDFERRRLCDKIAIYKGNIIFSFSLEMAKYLCNAYTMQYPLALLTVDERNPNSFPLGRKLLLHRSIDNNHGKGTANILSVKSLLEVCPSIPSYEEVQATGRQLDQRIKVPLETALDSLSSILSWQYCNSKGVPLTKEQAQATDYDTFITLYVKFEVKDYPDQTARLERKAERIAEAKAKKPRKTASKKKPATEAPTG